MADEAIATTQVLGSASFWKSQFNGILGSVQTAVQIDWVPFPEASASLLISDSESCNRGLHSMK